VPAAAAVDRGAAQDRQQPRTRMLTIEPIHRPVGTDQGVLHEVFRIRVLRRQRARYPQQHRDLGHHMPLKEVVAATSGVRIGVHSEGHLPARYRPRRRCATDPRHTVHSRQVLGCHAHGAGPRQVRRPGSGSRPGDQHRSSRCRSNRPPRTASSPVSSGVPLPDITHLSSHRAGPSRPDSRPAPGPEYSGPTRSFHTSSASVGRGRRPPPGIREKYRAVFAPACLGSG
jgi:hypothetical protein